MSAKDSSTTLEKAIALLWALYQNPDGLSASELARQLDSHRTALYRLLRPFLQSQFIRKGEGKRYYLGFGITALAKAVSDPVESLVREPLQWLANKTSCTTLLVADTDGTLVTIASYQPDQTGMHISAPIGFVHESSSVAREAIDSLFLTEGDHGADTFSDSSEFLISNPGTHPFSIATPILLPAVTPRSCIMLTSPSPINTETAVEALRTVKKQLNMKPAR